MERIYEETKSGKIIPKGELVRCKDCAYRWRVDMSVDDWTSYCDLLKVQVDDCVGWINRHLCPLESDRKEETVKQND